MEKTLYSRDFSQNCQSTNISPRVHQELLQEVTNKHSQTTQSTQSNIKVTLQLHSKRRKKQSQLGVTETLGSFCVCSACVRVGWLFWVVSWCECVCVWLPVMDWCPIQEVLLPHVQCSGFTITLTRINQLQWVNSLCLLNSVLFIRTLCTACFAGNLVSYSYVVEFQTFLMD